MTNDYDAEYDAFRDNSGRPSSGLRWISMLVIILFVVGFFLLVWYAYNQSAMSQQHVQTLDVIAPDSAEYRKKPQDSGGMKVDNADIESYQLLRREPSIAEDVRKVERLMPGTDKPIRQTPPTAEMLAINKAESSVSAAAPAPAQPERVIVAPRVAAPVVNSPAPVVKVTPKPRPAPVTTASTPAAPANAATNNQIYMQFAALRSKKEAQNMWGTLRSKHSGVLSGLSHYVESVTIAGTGTLYRLRAKGFTSRANALSICKQLKARGQDCLVSK